jgi:tetratricopeptide (TPR) repeat protein
MNQQLVIRICVALLVTIVGLLLWKQLMQSSDGTKLVGLILLGAGGGIVAVKFLLPWIGDAFGESMYSSGEVIEQDEMAKAAACISQGNYAGAIGHYEKMLEDKPDDSFPIAEIAKVHAERLHDPRAALETLSKHLQIRDWPVDDAAFLMFRISDVYMTHLHDFAAARDTLEQVIGQFPNTRHSANAHHKITEIEQVEFAHLQSQRAKTAATPMEQKKS